MERVGEGAEGTGSAAVQHGVIGHSIVGCWTELGSKCEWALVLAEH